MAELTGLLANHVIGQRFRTLKRLGSGSFGEIFIGIDATSGSELCHTEFFCVAAPFRRPTLCAPLPLSRR